MKRFWQFLFVLVLQAILYNQTGNVTIAWDPSPDIQTLDHYEILVTRDSGEVSTYGTSNTQITIPRISAGRFSVQVRAVGTDSNGNPATTPYCSSLNGSCAKRTDGSMGPWKILWKPTPGGPIQ